MESGQRIQKAENRSLGSGPLVWLFESFTSPTFLGSVATFMSPVTHSPAAVPVTPVLY